VPPLEALPTPAEEVLRRGVQSFVLFAAVAFLLGKLLANKEKELVLFSFVFLLC